MADITGDGPPNKRRKIASPAPIPSGSDSDFNFFLDNMMADLPDELMTASDSGTQNGTDSIQHSCLTNSQDSASQRHQQLSQLLANVPASASIANTNVNMNSTALNNTVKSPLSNNLQSTSHGLQGKSGPPASTYFLSDNNTFVSSNSLSFSLANSTSSTLSSMSLPNTMSMPNNMLNSISVSPHSVNNIPHTQNQLINGPHYSTSGVSGVRQPQVRGMMMNTSNLMGQGMSGMGMTQQNVIGAMNNAQMSRQPMDQTGMVQSSQHQMMKPNGPIAGGYGNYNLVQGSSGHPLSVSTANYNSNTNNPSTVLSSLSSPPHMSGHNANSVPQTQPVPLGGVPVAPGAPGQGIQPQSADPEKRKLIQQQLVLLLHAHKCQRREQPNGESCSLPHCRTMKNVLNHMTTCNAGKSCLVAHCASSRQIITHWKNCTRHDCPVCLPLKHASDRQQKQPGLQQANTAAQSAGPAATDVTTAGSLAVPQGMNDFELQKAYAALGLPYNGKQNSNLTGSNTSRAPINNQVNMGINASGQTMSGQMMTTQNNPLNSLLNTNNSLMGSDGLQNQIIAQTNRGTKEWHQSVTQELRNHLVYKLVQAIFPTPDPAALKDRRMNNLVAYARKVEGDMYETANSREEYYHFLAEKIYKIQKELEEKRVQRREQQQKQQLPGSDVTGMGGLRPSTNGSMSNSLSNVCLPGSSSDHFGNQQNMVAPGIVSRMAVIHQQQLSRTTPPLVNVPVSQMNSVPNTNQYDSIGVRMTNTGHLLNQQSQLQQHQLPQHSANANLLASKPRAMVPQVHQGSMISAQSQMQQSLPSSNNLASMVSRPSTDNLVSMQLSVASNSTMHSSMVMEPLSSMGGVKKIKLEGTMDVSTQPQTLTEVLSSPNPASSDKGPVMTPVLTSSSPTSTYAPSTCLDSKSEIKIDIKTEIKQEPMSVQIKDELPSIDSATVGTPKTEPMDANDDIKPSPMDIGQSSSTPVQSPAPQKLKCKKVFKPDELRQALMPTLEKLYRQDPESLPFRQPVDPIVLQIPDYYEIVRKPMDLSTIKRKLDTGQYKDPWEYVDDVWLMFDNAWVYNKKSSRVYKYCTKLSEVFEQEINSVMQSLGYCCGIKQSYSPQVLCCYGKQLCTIPRETVYYCYSNRSSQLLSDKYTYCEKCFLEIQGNEVELIDDPSQPTITVQMASIIGGERANEEPGESPQPGQSYWQAFSQTVRSDRGSNCCNRKVPKEQFVKLKNDVLEMEPFVDCDECGRKLHKICVLHFEPIWNNGFTCENCLKAKNMKRKENKYSAKRLPSSKLGSYLENRINTFLKKKDAGAGEVFIKVLSSSDKVVEVRPGMKSKFVDTGEFPDQFPYKAKSMFVFEEIDGTDVCFFGMHVQEYGSEALYPNSRRVYISYLDSVHFFQPRQLRTAVYHELLIGYLEYVKSLGYVWAHIWACPPSEGDDYIFHCHPPEQKIPKPKRLQEWYKKMLDKALIERVVIDYKDIYKDCIENNITKVTELPYFEGDFWPNVLEDCIKEQDQEEEEKRKREEAEALALEADGSNVNEEEESNTGMAIYEGSGKKKGKSQKKKNFKNKNTYRKAVCKKLNLPHGGNDLTAKLYSTMEKHKEVFFVIRLHTAQVAANLPPIHDPDPHMSCELMDGRDALLTLARDKHYEFSSLRRAKYSSIALLYELHNQGKENFVYTCNTCEAQVETRWHCSVCTDFDLCNTCYKKESHPHRMDRLGFDLDDGSSGGDKQDPLENRRQSLQRVIQSLVHACQCRDANCRLPSCHKIKRLVSHTKACRKKTNLGCPFCKQLIALCCHHAKQCNETKCPVPFCLQIKHKLHQQQLQLRLQQAKLMRRRMATMQMSKNPTPAASTTTSAVPSPSLAGVGKGSGGPPPGAMQAALEAQEAAQRQAGSSGKPQIASAMPPPKSKPQVASIGKQPMAIPQQWSQPPQQMAQQSAPIIVDQSPPQQSFPSTQPAIGQVRPMQQMQQRMSLHNSAMVNMSPSAMDMNSTMNANRQMLQRPPQSQGGSNEALEQLLRTLKSPTSPQQQQQVIQILKSYPQLMAAFIKQRNPQAPQSQVPMQQPRPVNPQMAMPNLQQNQTLSQQQEMIWQQQRFRLQQQAQQQVQQQVQQQQQMVQQPQIGHFNPPFNQVQQRTQIPQYSQQRFQGDAIQQYPKQNHQQMMQHVQQQQAQLKQQMAGGQPISSQQILSQQSVNANIMQQVRPPSSSTLHQAVRSPQPTPSPRQQLNPSPRQPQMSPHHIPPKHSQHPNMQGGGGPSDYNQMNDQIMLAQLQSHNSMPQVQNNSLDIGHGLLQDSEVNQLAPQDQLSRYVETL